MGVDYVIDSIKILEGLEPQDRYPTYAWRDIDWETILENVGINLGILYDNAINYWSRDQVKDMYEIIKKYYEQLKDNDKLKNDTYKLMGHFEYYVLCECIIRVF